MQIRLNKTTQQIAHTAHQSMPSQVRRNARTSPIEVTKNIQIKMFIWGENVNLGMAL